MTRTEIGVIAHNEAGNLGRLIRRLIDEPGDHRVCIVSSGSTDGTDEIAQAWARRDDRIRAVIEPERRGKARAINRFLADVAPTTKQIVLVSGDVLPEHGALGRLLEPLAEPDVCMTGARPCPDNSKGSLIGLVVHFQWDLLDSISRQRPKLGEMVALKAPVLPINPDSIVDEAALEAQLTRTGSRLAYVAGARVQNRGPSTWSDLVAQRERIRIGHRQLQAATGYRVTTHRLVDLVLPTIRFLFRHPWKTPIALAAACVEVWARVQASRSKNHPSVWPKLESTRIRLGTDGLRAPGARGNSFR